MNCIVLGKTYKITMLPPSDMMDLFGACDRRTQEIRLVDNMAEDQLRETLLHEIIHIVDRELNLGFPEDVVMRLAVGIYSTGCWKPEI